MIKVLVVDDEKHGADAAAKMVKQIPDLKLVGKMTNPIDALNLITTGKLNVDIVLLDIGMEGMPGDEFCKRLGNRAVVIFITGYNDYAVTAFRLGAVDYLLKPIQIGDFIEAINKARQKLLAPERMMIFGHEERNVFIKLSPTNIHGVALNDLRYVASRNKVVYLHMASKEKPVMINRSLNYMEDTLPKDMFLRINQSYLANMTFVKEIVTNKLILKDGEVLEIGSTYMQVVYSMF
jgi:two-component system LytT family response regulator